MLRGAPTAETMTAAVARPTRKNPPEYGNIVVRVGDGPHGERHRRAHDAGRGAQHAAPRPGRPPQFSLGEATGGMAALGQQHESRRRERSR